MSELSGLSVHVLNATPRSKRRRMNWAPGNLVGLAILVAILWRVL